LAEASFDERKGFIVKVYSIISLQLAVTFALCSLSYTSLAFRGLLLSNGNLSGFGWLCFFFSLAAEITLFCFKNVARRVPNNYIILGVFTFCFSIVVAASCSLVYEFYENGPELVLASAFLTLATTIGLTFYAYTTERDFTIYGKSQLKILNLHQEDYCGRSLSRFAWWFSCQSSGYLLLATSSFQLSSQYSMESTLFMTLN
jgi:FtsH-binding integral membrane protein